MNGPSGWIQRAPKNAMSASDQIYLRNCPYAKDAALFQITDPVMGEIVLKLIADLFEKDFRHRLNGTWRTPKPLWTKYEQMYWKPMCARALQMWLHMGFLVWAEGIAEDDYRYPYIPDKSQYTIKPVNDEVSLASGNPRYIVRWLDERKVDRLFLLVKQNLCGISRDLGLTITRVATQIAVPLNIMTRARILQAQRAANPFVYYQDASRRRKTAVDTARATDSLGDDVVNDAIERSIDQQYNLDFTRSDRVSQEHERSAGGARRGELASFDTPNAHITAALAAGPASRTVLVPTDMEAILESATDTDAGYVAMRQQLRAELFALFGLTPTESSAASATATTTATAPDPKMLITLRRVFSEYVSDIFHTLYPDCGDTRVIVAVEPQRGRVPFVGDAAVAHKLARSGTMHGDVPMEGDTDDIDGLIGIDFDGAQAQDPGARVRQLVEEQAETVMRYMPGNYEIFLASHVASDYELSRSEFEQGVIDEPTLYMRHPLVLEAKIKLDTLNMQQQAINLQREKTQIDADLKREQMTSDVGMRREELRVTSQIAKAAAANKSKA
jgi:hypothetical protein